MLTVPAVDLGTGGASGAASASGAVEASAPGSAAVPALASAPASASASASAAGASSTPGQAVNPAPALATQTGSASSTASASTSSSGNADATQAPVSGGVWRRVLRRHRRVRLQAASRPPAARSSGNLPPQLPIRPRSPARPRRYRRRASHRPSWPRAFRRRRPVYRSMQSPLRCSVDWLRSLSLSLLLVASSRRRRRAADVAAPDEARSTGHPGRNDAIDPVPVPPVVGLTGAADLEGASVIRDQSELNAVAASLENYDAAQSFDTQTEELTPSSRQEREPAADETGDGAKVTLGAVADPAETGPDAARAVQARRAPFMPEAPAARHRDFIPPLPGEAERYISKQPRWRSG